jgi:putative transposase
MARLARIELPNTVYYITSKSRPGRSIFRSDDDRSMFIEIIQSVIRRYGWRCYAYCLLDDSYHIIVETTKANLSLGMRQVNGVYTKRVNAKHNNGGQVLDGRFKSIIIEKSRWLQEMIRWIAVLPVKLRLAGSPIDWRWSSYGEVMRHAQHTCIDVARVLDMFSENESEKMQAFKAYIETDVTAIETPLKNIKNRRILGNNDFAGRCLQSWKESRLKSTGTGIEKQEIRPLLEPYLQEHITNLAERDRRIFQAYHQHGYMLNEIAKASKLDYTSISKIITAQEKSVDFASRIHLLNDQVREAVRRLV